MRWWQPAADAVLRPASGVAAAHGAEIPTADEDRGLGTGETDYSVQTDIFKFLDRGMLIGTLGYRVRGDPTGVEIEDTWHASIGGLLRGLSDTSFDWGAGVSVGHDF